MTGLYLPAIEYTILYILVTVLLTTSVTSVYLLVRSRRRREYDIEASGDKGGAWTDTSVPEIRLTFPDGESRHGVTQVVVSISQAGCAFVVPVHEKAAQ